MESAVTSAVFETDVGLTRDRPKRNKTTTHDEARLSIRARWHAKKS